MREVVRRRFIYARRLLCGVYLLNISVFLKSRFMTSSSTNEAYYPPVAQRKRLGRLGGLHSEIGAAQLQQTCYD